ncbi:MAG TPA: RNA methyltransferase [Chitinispirillaceae bacterium]|nr:RNA methyltransferase [Chitinispirillaceae bacterium]
MKWYKSLSNSKSRQQEGYFLVEGFRATEQIVNAYPESVEEILISEIKDTLPFEHKCPVRTLTESQLDSICTSHTPQGIVSVVKLPQRCYTAEPPQNYGSAILMLEHVQDPGNVGTLIRTAAAFNYSGVLLSSQCADPFSPKVVQSSSGAILSVWIRRTDYYLEMVSRFKTDGLVVLAADVYGDQRFEDIKNCSHVLALGNEGAGLSAELLSLCNTRFQIPFDSSKVESLNVAVAGAIAMFYLKNRSVC